MTHSSTIKPTSPVAPWLGGKRNLSRILTKIIDDAKPETYVEPFVGMGGIFLRRTFQSRAEIINDISGDITTLFRILQRHYPQFIEVLRFQLTTRTEFERLKVTDPKTLTDLERAARFLYLQRTAFGGKVGKRNFGVAKDRPARFNLTTLEPMLEDLHTRLAGVVIECLPYAQLIDRYDSTKTMFYLDPPYWGCEDDYGKELFGADDFVKLKAIISTVKGGVIMSINDVPEIREIFAGFQTIEVETSYGIAARSGTSKGRKELIILNR